MSSDVVGVNPQVINNYIENLQTNFQAVHNNLTELVHAGFALEYEGPDAADHFNPGLRRVMENLLAGTHETMEAYATAVGTVTSNIASALGQSGVQTVRYVPPPIELPAAPGLVANDFRIDLRAFQQYVNEILPQSKRTVSQLVEQNRSLISGISRSGAGMGWAGQSRDLVESQIVPRQVENMSHAISTGMTNIEQFIDQAITRASAADGRDGGAASLGGIS